MWVFTRLPRRRERGRAVAHGADEAATCGVTPLLRKAHSLSWTRWGLISDVGAVRLNRTLAR
ncbi:hypothetical protein MPNT_70090 [Candidatus Methylacidithermus pantelleriae]|uniref:Uncharacterized protein n=1 Tax=Candidatus Methylacidithermus pantelleriae TaxID=2744239 RepID=A0A8J2BWF6_9BACT|nr:hypothetical protein MPNT_70090 [Candidatus Methylacidithermus pantelleriae]